VALLLRGAFRGDVGYTNSRRRASEIARPVASIEMKITETSQITLRTVIETGAVVPIASRSLPSIRNA